MKRQKCTLCGQKERPASPVEMTVLGTQKPGTAPILEAAWSTLLDVVAEREPVSVLDAAPVVAARAGCSVATVTNLAYAGVNLGRLRAEHHRRRTSGRKALHLALLRESDQT